MLPDGRVICQNLLEQCQSYEDNYAREIPIDQLATIASNFMQQYTHYSSVRPFGCSLFITNGEQLYFLQPSGDFFNSFAASAGKKSGNARVELEKLIGEQQSSGTDRFGHLKKSRNDGGNLNKIELDQSMSESAKIMWTVFDENQDMKWYCEGALVSKAGIKILEFDEMQ